MQRRDYEENNQAREETHTHTHDDKVDDDDDEVDDDDGPDGDDLDHDDLDPTKRLRKQQFHQKDYDDDIEHRMFALTVWLVPLSKYHLLFLWPDHLVGAALL